MVELDTAVPKWSVTGTNGVFFVTVKDLWYMKDDDLMMCHSK
jgi:uncharacterized protein YneR